MHTNKYNKHTLSHFGVALIAGYGKYDLLDSWVYTEFF